tara:strand:+ start:631 stop:1962 length:1332 start_codon:yes stop_codon:yes gene_type:complete
MRTKNWLAIFASPLFLILATKVSAKEAALSRPEKVAIVEALDSTLIANYVFPDIARSVGPVLREKLQNGDYASASTKAEMAQKLTEDLVKITHDLHFAVGVDQKWVADYRSEKNPVRKAEIRKEELAELEKTNFGFDAVSRLDGNIGYIRFSYFANPELAYDAAAATMRFVENSDAIIIDLRYNDGGYLEMAQFLASYFFAADKDQLLFDYYYNEDGKRIDRGQWVLPALPGKRMTDKPLYILTGSTSFSSAEWFSYAMKKLGRATIIGERTAGGAHPVDRKPVNDDFFLQVPIGQIRDPVDFGDFEGVGVQPDVPTSSIHALALAQKLALENLAKTAPSKAEQYAWFLPALTAQIQPADVDADQMTAMVGKYEGREINRENGTLFYIWRDRFRVALAPLGSNLFAVEGVADFRYRPVYENGKVTALERINRTGPNQVYKRID